MRLKEKGIGQIVLEDVSGSETEERSTAGDVVEVVVGVRHAELALVLAAIAV